jgi:hypothetical protein
LAPVKVALPPPTVTVVVTFATHALPTLGTPAALPD